MSFRNLILLKSYLQNRNFKRSKVHIFSYILAHTGAEFKEKKNMEELNREKKK